MQSTQRETNQTSLNTLAQWCYQQCHGENRLIEIARFTKMPIDVVERIFTTSDATAEMPKK